MIIGRDDNFHEDFGDGARRSFIYRAIESDDAAECGYWIARKRLSIGFFRCRAKRRAGRVCVLDDCTGELIKVTYKLPRRVGVDVVVEGHFLAVE